MSEIYRPYVERTAISFEAHAPDAIEMKKRIQTSMQRHVWFVCEYNRNIIGYAYAGKHNERDAYQWVAETSVYVHEKFHRKRIAHALYGALHDALQLQGYVLLLAGMTLPNDASAAFHRAMGFKPFATFERIGFKFNTWHSTQWWRKEISTIKTPGRLHTVAELAHTPEWETMMQSAVSIIKN